jgi:colanic acid biosynthesis glycosyl transferase WcaI
VLISLPTSRAAFRIHLSPIDAALAAAAPWAALHIRNGELVSNGDWVATGSYCLVSMVFSLIALQVFRIGNSIPRYMSVSDLLGVAKAVLSGQLTTTILLFTVTRLEGIPRSVPAIQAVVLGAGLVAHRGVAYFSEKHHCDRAGPHRAIRQNVILIGLNEFTALLTKFLKTQVPERSRVIALLDEQMRWIGRSVAGVQIFGPPAQLEAVVEEFVTHGVRTDRVLINSEAAGLSPAALVGIQDVCARRNLDLIFMPDLLPFRLNEYADLPVHKNPDPPSSPCPTNIPISPYFRVKRIIDTFVAAMLIFWLLPLLLIASVVAILDVGSPVLFWQLRVGRDGRELQIYKVRTLRPLFDRNGQRIPDDQRLSWIGRRLRDTRIDELPQLLNVLVGDMSLIGPRPLLPVDQPPNSAGRLLVRPGLTGWAQVNGGGKLSAMEKDALDLWYICNASPLLDLRILGMTLLSLLRGDRRSEKALAHALSFQAQRLQAQPPGRSKRGMKSGSLVPTAVGDPPREDARDAVGRAIAIMLWPAFSGHTRPAGERQTEISDEPRSGRDDGRPVTETAASTRSTAKRVIFLNRFFFPDHSATSQILTDLAFHLAASGIQVRVVTSRQRYDDPEADLPEAESICGVAIYRISTTRFGRSALIGRGFDYFSFYMTACRSVLAWAKPGDLLVAKTDPPLLCIAAKYVANRRGLHLINWLQDLYPEVAAELGVPFTKGPLGRALLQLRDASLRAAAANVVVGERMAEALRNRGISPGIIHVIPNWCDDEEIQPVAPLNNPLRREWGLEGRFVVCYSGNLGRAHEFETVLAAAERLRGDERFCFLFIGGGKKFDELIRSVRERRLNHLFRFVPYQERKLLKLSLGVADIHLISLRPELEGLIVPSKLYGIAAAGRPIIAIAAADGEVGRLVQRHGCGVVVEPGQGEHLSDTLLGLPTHPVCLAEMGRRARAMLETQFTRRHGFERWRTLVDEIGITRRPSEATMPAAHCVPLSK